METKQEHKNSTFPDVEIDPSLNKYRDNTPFPEKLAMAKKVLRTAKLPGRNFPVADEELKHETL